MDRRAIGQIGCSTRTSLFEDLAAAAPLAAGDVVVQELAHGLLGRGGVRVGGLCSGVVCDKVFDRVYERWL